MSSPEYSHLLAEAQQINSRMQKMNHPCIAGNAACCEEENVSITREDYIRILNAALSGEVPWSVFEDASGRIGNGSCSFLTDDKLCSLQNDKAGYNVKPLVCESTGVPAALSSEGLEQLSKKNAKLAQRIREGKEKLIPYSVCVSTMCHDCHETLEKRHARVTFDETEHAYKVHMYRHRNHWGNTNQAVQKILQSKNTP